MGSSKAATHRLQEVCSVQAGFFTAKQAQNAGFSASSHTYHVLVEHWVREYRGIYRLTAFPEVLRPELPRWHLWAFDRAGRAQGVYSHSTALGLYLFPRKRTPVLHMTVPTGFRRSSETPEGLELHFADLPETDISAGEGYRLTTPLRTFLDLAGSGTMARAALSQALLRMVEQGLIQRSQIRTAKIPEESRLQLEALLLAGEKKR